MAADDTSGGHWLARVWPILSQASGVTVLIMMVMLGLVYIEMRRVHRNNEHLVEVLLTTKDDHLTWVRTLVRCAPPER